MEEDRKANSLLPPMPLDSERLDPLSSAELEEQRSALAERLQKSLDAREFDGLVELAQQLADMELTLGMRDAALGSYRRASQLLRDQGNIAGLAANLYAIAEIERAKGRYGEAETSYVEAGVAYREAEDPCARITCLLCAGEMRALTNRAEAAIDLYGQATTIAEELQIPLARAYLLLRTAESLVSVDPEGAKAQFAEAEKLFVQVDKDITIDPGDRVANPTLPTSRSDLRKFEPWVLAKLCKFKSEQPNFGAAPKATKLAPPKASANDQKKLMGMGALAAAMLLFALGYPMLTSTNDFTTSGSGTSAVPARPAQPPAAERAVGFRNKAAAAFTAGDSEKARELYAQALALFEKLRNRKGQATVLLALAKIEESVPEESGDRSERVRELYQQALALFVAVGNTKGRAESIAAIVEIDEAGQDRARMRSSYEHALSLYEFQDDLDAQIQTLQRIAALDLQEKDLAQSHETLLHLLQLQESANTTRGVATTLERLAAIEAITDSEHKARIKLERAYTLHRENNHIEGQARSLIALGDLDMSGKNPRQARASYRQALSLVDNSGLDSQREALVKLGNAEITLGRNDRAAELFQRAFESCASSEDADCTATVQSHIDGAVPEVATLG